MTATHPSPTQRSFPMLHALADKWWLVLLRGIAGILFGLLAFLWPGITLITLVIFYGAYALVDGVLALLAVFKSGERPAPIWWLILVGVTGIIAGLLTFVWPGITALVLVLFIGAWAVVHGIFEIIGAIQLRKEIENEWLLILAGVISVIFGLMVLAAPGAGALALIWVIAAYAVVFGIILVAFSFKLRNHRHPPKPSA